MLFWSQRSIERVETTFFLLTQLTAIGDPLAFIVEFVLPAGVLHHQVGLPEGLHLRELCFVIELSKSRHGLSLMVTVLKSLAEN